MPKDPMSYDGFVVGQRVELHPATDLWMRGARYGEIVRITWKSIHVRLDATNRVHRVHPTNLMHKD